MPLKRPTGDDLANLLERATGHRFRDSFLMQRALTHASARGKVTDNERLEFLGDRVLGLVVAELLFRSYPESREGELAVRLAALVSAATCASVAEEIGLIDWIRADSGVKARKARNVPADAVEALIAAIYLEGGLEGARAFVLRYWEPRVSAVAAAHRDPKTELQEWAHQAAHAAPAYQIDRREGPDHEPLFTISVRVGGLAPASGTGRSKREAEQAAAAALLVREGVWVAEESHA